MDTDGITVDISAATEADLPAILALYAVADIDAGAVLPLENARLVFQRMMTYPDYAVYIARCDERVVGTFALAIMDNLAHRGSPSGLVEDVVVAEDMRSKGIGKAMMEYALWKCTARGCYKMCLSSNLARTDAHRFYEKLGFRKHGFSFTIDL